MLKSKVLFVVVATGLALAAVHLREGEAKARPAKGSAAKARGAQVVELTVTADGFVPAEVKASVGRPLKLLVTRKVQRTCASDIVIKAYGIHRPLPLNQTVTVSFTPTKPGRIRYACAMDMIAGVVLVE